MPTDPDHDQNPGPEDAPNQGVSSPDPAEGGDKAPDVGSPTG